MKGKIAEADGVLLKSLSSSHHDWWVQSENLNEQFTEVIND